MNIWPALERRDIYKVRSIDMYEPALFIITVHLSGNGPPGMTYYIMERDGMIKSSGLVRYAPGAKEMVL